MSSINHQYVQYNDSVVKRYVKTTPSIVTGLRLNPNDINQTLPFQLQTPDKYFDIKAEPHKPVEITRKFAIDYDEEVLELYSEREAKIFERLNRALLQAGILTEYKDVAPEIDLHNMLNDEEVENIANTKQLSAFKKRIASIDSARTLERIKIRAIEIDRPISIIQAVMQRIAELLD